VFSLAAPVILAISNPASLGEFNTISFTCKFSHAVRSQLLVGFES
jgi:hypothetical protein